MRNEETHFSIPWLASLRMNRKGDVATIMIVVVAFIFVIASLLIFLDFKAKFENMQGLDEIMREAEFGEKYIISEAELIGKDAILDRNEGCQGEGDLSYKFRCNGALRDLDISLAGNFFAKVENYEFSFVHGDKYFYELSIKGVKIKSERGANSIVREFNVEMGFDEKGKVLESKTIGNEKTG